MTRQKQIEDRIIQIENEKEKLDKELAEIVWEEALPYTLNLEDIPKAVVILNRAYQTPEILDLFTKLRWIKQELGGYAIKKNK